MFYDIAICGWSCQQMGTEGSSTAAGKHMSSTTETKLLGVFLTMIIVLSTFGSVTFVTGSAAAANDAANSSIDTAGNMYDEPLDSGEAHWAGQDLVFEAANGSGDAGQNYAVHEAADTQSGATTGTFVTDVTLDENGEAVINTTALAGDYVLLDSGNDVRNVSDGIVGDSVTGDRLVEAASFNVTQHALNLSFARSQVLTGENVTITNVTNRAEPYAINISAQGLNSSELARIFQNETGPSSFVGNGARVNGPDSLVEYPNSDTVAIGYPQSDGELDAQFGDQFNASAPATYTFEYSVQDSTASGSMAVDVRESPVLDDSGVDPANLTTDRVTFSVRHRRGQYDQVHSYPSDATATIFVGTVNRSETTYGSGLPVPNASVAVEIRRPDGQVDTRNVMTNSNGTARIQYDLSGKPDGRYGLDTPSVSSYSGEFRVGNVTKVVPQGDRLIVGQQTPFTVHVTENGRPLDVSRTVRIQAANGSQLTRTVQTGADGFARFTYTPQESGDVFVTTDTGNTQSVYAQAGTATAEVTLNGQEGQADIPGGGRVAIGATVISGGQPLSNGQVTVQIRNQSNNNAVVETFTVNTNGNGQFATTWTAPDAPEHTDYSVAMYDGGVSDANAISTGFSGVEIENDITTPSTGGGGGGGGTVAPPEIYFEQTPYGTAAPGQTQNYTIRVEDNDNDPVTDKEVFYTLYIGYDVPIKSGYVTTDDTGRATIRERIPADVTRGEDVRIGVYTRVNGTDIADTDYSGRTNEIVVDTSYSDSNDTPDLQPGERFTYEAYVDYASNGTDVAGFPVSSALTVAGSGVGMATLNATVVETNSNGVARFSGRVPADATGRVRVDSWALPGVSDNLYFGGSREIQNFTTSLEEPDGFGFYPGTVDAGTDLTFQIRADNPPVSDKPVTAVVTVGTDDDYATNESRIGPNTVLHSEVVSLGQGTARNVSIQIPSTIVDEQDYTLYVDATTPNGPLTNAEQRRFTVNSSRTPDNARPVPSVTVADQVAVNDTFVVDASDSVDDTGIVNYTVQTQTGETVTSTTPVIDVPGFETTGTYDVTLYVTDSVGKTESVTTQVEAVEAADLVGDLSAPAESRFADELVVNYTVSNDGVEPTNGNVTVNLTAVGPQGATVTDETEIDGVAANTRRNLSTNLTSFVTSNDVTGPVALSLTVTGPQNLTEPITDNNNDTATTQVTFADLNASVYVSGDTFQDSTVTVYGFIENRGTATSSAGTANFTVDGTTVQYDLPALEPGAVNRTSQTLTLTGDTTASLSVSGDAFPAGNETSRTLSVDPFTLSDLDVDTYQDTVEAGDTFRVWASFDANAETDVTAALDLPDGLSTGRFSSANETEHVYDGRNWVSWRVEADDSRQTPYEMNVTVRGGGETVNGTRNVTVTVPTVRVQDSDQMVLDNDGETQTGTVEVPNATTTAHTFTVDVSAGTTGRSLEGLDYLVDYPYGCVEQTTSPMLSGLYVDQYYRNGSINYDEQKVDDSVEQGIARLEPDGTNGQHTTGAWSMWGNEPSGDMFYTVYAMFGTSSVANDPIQGDRTAIDAEIQNGADTINYSSAVSWLADEQNADGSFRAGHYLEDREAVTGFTLIGLEKAADAGLNASASSDLSTIRGSATEYLLAEQQADGSWGSAQSTALAVWGLQTTLDANDPNVDDTAVQNAIDNGTNWLVNNQQGDGGWEQYHSSYAFDSTGDRSEATAYALLALNATGVDNTNTTVVAGTDYLADIYEEDGSWGYTRATALAVRALTVTAGDTEAARTVDITVGTGTSNPITRTVTVDDNTTEISLTASELQRLRDASDSTTRSVEASTRAGGDGRVYISFENDQVVNELEYQDAP